MIDITSLSVSELSELIAAATSEIASRQTVSGPRRVAIRYPSYNSRRYSRPWIARIIRWPVGGKPDLEFGSYCGDDKGGEVEIMAKPGDIIRDGQRQFLGLWHTAHLRAAARTMRACAEQGKEPQAK